MVGIVARAGSLLDIFFANENALIVSPPQIRHDGKGVLPEIRRDPQRLDSEIPYRRLLRGDWGGLAALFAISGIIGLTITAVESNAGAR